MHIAVVISIKLYWCLECVYFWSFFKHQIHNKKIVCCYTFFPLVHLLLALCVLDYFFLHFAYSFTQYAMLLNVLLLYSICNGVLFELASCGTSDFRYFSKDWRNGCRWKARLIFCTSSFCFRKKVPVHSLSIHRHLNNSYECGEEFYQELLALLNIHTPRVSPKRSCWWLAYFCFTYVINFSVASEQISTTS